MCESFKLCIHPTFPPLFFFGRILLYLKKSIYFQIVHWQSQPTIHPAFPSWSFEKIPTPSSSSSTSSLSTSCQFGISQKIYVYSVIAFHSWDYFEHCTTDGRYLHVCSKYVCWGFFYSFHSFLGFRGGLPFSSLGKVSGCKFFFGVCENKTARVTCSIVKK